MTEKIHLVNYDDYHLRNEVGIAVVRSLLPNNYKAHIETYGCQMNEHDSEKLNAMLSEMGYGMAEGMEDADLIIFNTCCVRENAELKVFGNLGRVKHLKKKKPELLVSVCGCMVQQPHIVEELCKKYPFVDLVFGTHNLHDFPQLLARTMQRGADDTKTIVNVPADGMEVVEGMPAIRERDTKAFVNINYGCNNFCTYCIVPYTRGRERSRRAEDIISEVTNLCANGTKEIMLLGQNVNSYGKEFQISFADLLRMLDKVEGLERLRFMTSHPKDISRDLIDAIADSKHICKQLHLPVQSGSDYILKRMNRGYTVAHYREMIAYARERCPEITVSTDIIVGFPGESDADFEATLTLVKGIEYDSAYTYIYSKRTGTPAATFPDQVPEDVKSKRLTQLVEAINEIVIQKMKSYVGKELPVLVESVAKRSKELYMGRTDGSITCTLPMEGVEIGDLVLLRITKARNFSLHGDVVRKLSLDSKK